MLFFIDLYLCAGSRRFSGHNGKIGFPHINFRYYAPYDIPPKILSR